MDAKHARRAFTLVELLVVVIIIGMLTGLITAAAVAALRNARRFTITSEITQLSMALEKYRQDYGDYPPDFAGVNDTDATVQADARRAVLRHLRIAFPRYQPGACPAAPSQGTWAGFVHDVQYASAMADEATGKSEPDITTGLNIDEHPLDPSSALVFWLGGPPSPGGTTLLAGFSANPANPFARGGSRLPPLFEFDEARLQPHKDNPEDPNDNVVYKYIPPHMPTQPTAGKTKAPYVYFRARGGQYDPKTAAYPQRNETALDTGTCVPYASEVSGSNENIEVTKWFNPQTFQIISAGLDGTFSEPNSGADGFIPHNPGDTELYKKARYLDASGGNLSPAEDDNLTNFSKGMLADGVQ